MKQYQDLLQEILDNGREKESGRANMPNTLGLSRGTILMENVEQNFPLLTTKKMFWKGIVHELLWFLRGETNIKYLVDNNVNIWNGDAYRWYLKYANSLEEPDYGYHADDPKENCTRVFTMEEFIENIKRGRLGLHSKYKLGDLGKVYGHQWRNQNGVDQIKDIYDDLKNNPMGRYKILDAWNKKEFPEMALPPCHLLYQFIVRPMTLQERDNWAWDNGLKEEYKKDAPLKYDEWIAWHDNHNVPKYYLDLNMYQRSVDTFLGAPFNLASMSLLLMIMAKAVGMVTGDAFWIGGDTHLYLDHLDVVREQISREPMQLPQMKIDKELNSLEDIMELSIDDFELVGYESHDKLKAELFTGLKKK